MRRLAFIVSAGLFFTLPSVSLAAENASSQALEQLIIRTAVDAEQHTALASHFRTKAAIARGEAEREERMGRSSLYTPGNAGMQRFVRARRAEAAQRHLAKAESFDAQARLHETAASRLAGETGSADEQARLTR